MNHMITLTENAINKIKEVSEAEGLGYFSVRVKVQGGGCAGFTQDMAFDEQILEMDEVFEVEGVKIVCDAVSYTYLEGTEIDFVDSPIGAGFKFLNPNSKGTCGCGSSNSF